MNETRVNRHLVEELSKAMNLEMTFERQEALAHRLSKFLDDFDELYRIDVGDLQPPAISFDREHQK